MARAQQTDFLQSFRYQVSVSSVDGTPRLQAPGRPEAGFSNVSTPEVTTENAEYREGTFIYTRKQPGVPSMADITMSRGVTREDSSFYDWIRVVNEGSGEYRADVDIQHFHRDTALNREFPTDGSQPNKTDIDTNSPAKIYHVREAYPIRVKQVADLDATSSEISVGEIDITYETFEVENFAAP